MIGEHLGPYRILNRLGRGGMGEVFQAEATEGDEVVALKVLNGQVEEDDPELSRFRREGQLLGALDHPGIVRALSPLNVDGGRAWYAMEFVAGRDLARVLREEGALPPARAVAIARETLEALAFAHEKGVVHRDVKPSNVLIDATGRVRLADFGLARMAGLTKLTRSGTVLGTPEYMAPEQARGQDAEAPADIYAQGVVLFEMLSGRPPFQAEQPLAVLRMHMDDPLPALAAPSPLPAGLEGIVRRALAKEPGDRWPSAQAMLDALRDLGEVPVVDSPPRAEQETAPLALPRPVAETAPLQPVPPPVAVAGGTIAKGGPSPDAVAEAPSRAPRRVVKVVLLSFFGLLIFLGALTALLPATQATRMKVTPADDPVRLDPEIESLPPQPTPTTAASPKPERPRVSVKLRGGGAIDGTLLDLDPKVGVLVVQDDSGTVHTLSVEDVEDYTYPRGR